MTLTIMQPSGCSCGGCAALFQLICISLDDIDNLPDATGNHANRLGRRSIDGSQHLSEQLIATGQLGELLGLLGGVVMPLDDGAAYNETPFFTLLGKLLEGFCQRGSGRLVRRSVRGDTG